MTKQKTAIAQEINSTNNKIDILKSRAENFRLERDYLQQNKTNFLVAELQSQANMLESLLSIGKQQIKQAYADGIDDYSEKGVWDVENYFNEKFE